MSESQGFVTVGCKLPNGMFIDMKDKSGDARRVKLNGANDSRIVGGYGLTEGVPADLITEWLKKNAKHPAVMNKHIFVHSETASAVAIAKEHREIQTGIEAIDPVKRGMLNGADGRPDPKALGDYNQQRATNPRRNAQQVE